MLPGIPQKTDHDLSHLTRERDRAMSSVFLGNDAAFYGPLMSSLEFIWSYDIPTAATDGVHFWWNPNDFVALPFEERCSTIQHELEHVARLHMIRGESKQHHEWNIACDIRINRDLRIERHSLPPPMWIQNHSEIRAELEEEIYEILVKNSSAMPKIGNGNEQTHMLPGNLTSGDVKSKAITNVIQAVHHAKISGKPGSIPGGIEQIISKFLAPVVPWEQVLHRFMQDLLEDDYTWSLPDRRFDPMELYLPSLFTDEGRLQHLAYYWDVSGSISDEDEIRFNSEVKYLWETYQPKKLSLIQFDTRITSEQTFEDGDDFSEIKIKGRGGTCLIPVRKHIQETKPTAAIIFSDLFVAPMQPLDEPIPIIWVAVNNSSAKVPFGELVHIKG